MTDFSTVDRLFHHLWSARAGTPGYDYREKRLWMALQRFVERNGGLTQPAERYNA